MNDEQVGRAIDEMERSLRAEDPMLLKRVGALQRSETVAVVSVFVLIASGAVLLTVGLATLTMAAWCLGVGAFAASFLVDRHHQRTLRRVGDRNDRTSP